MQSGASLPRRYLDEQVRERQDLQTKATDRYLTQGCYVCKFVRFRIVDVGSPLSLDQVPSKVQQEPETASANLHDQSAVEDVRTIQSPDFLPDVSRMF